MKLLVCSIFDSATRAFMQPFFVRTKPEAIRVFADAVNDGKSQFASHPEDYILHYLCDYDDADGTFTSGALPVKLVTGNECVRSE